MIIPPFAPKEALSRRRGQLGNGLLRVGEARLQPLRRDPRRGTQDLQSLWKDSQSLWKENPNHEEGKSKPVEAKSKLSPFRESSLFKGLRRPPAAFFFFGRLQRNRIIGIKVNMEDVQFARVPPDRSPGVDGGQRSRDDRTGDRTDHGGMDHLSGDQIIRPLFSESQEFVYELWLTACQARSSQLA